MKRVLALVAVFSLVLGVSGCSNNGGSEPVEITLAQGKPEIDGALKEYATTYESKNGVKVNIVSCGGDSCQLGDKLKADYQAGNMPDIFQIQGIEDYNEWKEIIMSLEGSDWMEDTSLTYYVDGVPYGFPVTVEGWGLAYNKDLLDQAGIDPATLVNYDGYVAAFEKLESMKADLGIDSVVSMAAGPGMYWVTADHNFNSLLSNGVDYDDMSVVDSLLAGDVDGTRLQEYGNWVNLLFKYADKNVLTAGGYSDQVNAFVNQKAVFVHQGNWIDGDLANAGASFNIGIAPQGSMKEDTNGIFVAAPSFYVINKDSKNVEAAKQFLSDMVYTEEGNDYIVNKAGMAPAFKNITLKPTGKMTNAVIDWNNSGNIYGWKQYNFSSSFRTDTLGPIYNQLATGAIDVNKFVELMTQAFKDNAK
ncbi:MAG: ABC transporter substrate-binding protein [Erysipelotrichaceae bacterium]